MNKSFWESALNRALRTVAQTALATIGTASMLSEVSWAAVLSTAVLGGFVSVLTSIVLGIPEAPDPQQDEDSARGDE